MRNPRGVRCAALLLLTLTATARAQTGTGAPASAARRLHVVRTTDPIKIDGKLDEPAWQTAPIATDFIQQSPTPGAPGSERTEARVLYDDAALYIGMRLYRTERGKIAAPIARRDYTGYSDWAQVMVDSYYDRRTAFRFAVNPSGVQKDALEFDDGNGEDLGWDAVWEAATQVDSLDMRHRFGADNYEITASAIASRIEGSPIAVATVARGPGHFYQRPDAAYLSKDATATALDGLATTAQVSKLGGRWRWTLAGLSRSPGFEPNDAGFQQSADWLVGGAQLGYVDFTPSRHIRDWTLFASGSAGWTFGGERRVTGIDVNGNIDWLNNWSLQVDVNHQFWALSVDALRGGPALRTPASSQGTITLASDPRRRIADSLTIQVSDEPETGGHTFMAQPVLAVRPSGRAEFGFGPLAMWTDNPWQYVLQASALGAPHYVFAHLRQTTAALTMRVSYAFTPTLTLQLYGEPYISAGRYSSFQQVSAPRAARFGDRFQAFTSSQVTLDTSAHRYGIDLDGDGAPDLSFKDPNFNFKQFRSTVVLRWEYRPGSALFVVWSQGRTAKTLDGSFRLGRDIGDLFGIASTNVLLVKASYRIDW